MDMPYLQMPFALEGDILHPLPIEVNKRIEKNREMLIVNRRQ